MSDPQHTTGEFTEYDKYIRLLNEAMRYKLRLNAHKGFLGDVPVERLIELICGEVTEIEEAAGRGNYIETIMECADICNFALGIMARIIKGTVYEPKSEPAGHGVSHAMVNHSHAPSAERGGA